MFGRAACTLAQHIRNDLRIRQLLHVKHLRKAERPHAHHCAGGYFPKVRLVQLIHKENPLMAQVIARVARIGGCFQHPRLFVLGQCAGFHREFQLAAAGIHHDDFSYLADGAYALLRVQAKVGVRAELLFGAVIIYV